MHAKRDPRSIPIGQHKLLGEGIVRRGEGHAWFMACFCLPPLLLFHHLTKQNLGAEIPWMPDMWWLRFLLCVHDQTRNTRWDYHKHVSISISIKKEGHVSLGNLQRTVSLLSWWLQNTSMFGAFFFLFAERCPDGDASGGVLSSSRSYVCHSAGGWLCFFFLFCCCGCTQRSPSPVGSRGLAIAGARSAPVHAPGRSIHPGSH